MAVEIAEACGLDTEGPWPTVRAACGGVMPGPNDVAAIDAAWALMLAVGEAAGYLDSGVAPNILSALAGLARATAAEYFLRLLRVTEVAVFLPEPMFYVTELFYVDGAAGYAWLTELRRRLPTLAPTTWGDAVVGLEDWVGKEPLLTSVLGAGDDWANERDARMTARLAPVLRAGHGAIVGGSSHSLFRDTSW